jgi:hypothetical protein
MATAGFLRFAALDRVPGINADEAYIPVQAQRLLGLANKLFAGFKDHFGELRPGASKSELREKIRSADFGLLDRDSSTSLTRGGIVMSGSCMIFCIPYNKHAHVAEWAGRSVIESGWAAVGARIGGRVRVEKGHLGMAGPQPVQLGV